MFKSKITKEEINLLPPTSFDGEIYLVDEQTKLPYAIDILKNQTEIGFDTETKPSFKKGEKNKVALLQLSTLTHSFLFRLNKIGFPKELMEILTNKKIKKIGLALRDDISGLNGHKKFRVANSVDLQTIVNNYGIFELGLQKIFALIFNEKISKRQQLSNWEKDELSEQQALYAAIDAWACLKIYLELKAQKPLPKKEVAAISASLEAIRKQEKEAKEQAKAQTDLAPQLSPERP